MNRAEPALLSLRTVPALSLLPARRLTARAPVAPRQRRPAGGYGSPAADAAERARLDAATVDLLAAALAQRGVGVSACLSPGLSRSSRIVKRCVDILGASAILLLVSPVLLVAAIAVIATSRGPGLFVQERVGLGGRTFRMYKLRSMRVEGDDRQHREYVARLIRGEAQDEAGVYKLVKDPRITRAGRALRRYSIDELPQLWNVLLGHMSLVGPRPALPHEVELYDEVARERLVVKPGLTGAWQVGGRCRLSFAEMVALDVRYWKHWSLRTDLLILAKTPLAALSGRGAA